MMEISFLCCKCGEKLTSDDSHLLITLECPHCGKQFSINLSDEYLPYYRPILKDRSPELIARGGLPLSFASPRFTSTHLSYLSSYEGTRKIFPELPLPLLCSPEDLKPDTEDRYDGSPIMVFWQPYLLYKDWKENNRERLIFWLRQMNVSYQMLRTKINKMENEESPNELQEEPGNRTIDVKKKIVNFQNEKLTSKKSKFHKAIYNYVSMYPGRSEQSILNFCKKRGGVPSDVLSQINLLCAQKLLVLIGNLYYKKEDYPVEDEEICDHSDMDEISVSEQNKEPVIKSGNLSVADFSDIDSFTLTSTVIREMLRRKLQLKTGGPFENLRTIQWCQNVLNLRYPLIRMLKVFESPSDFKETFVPLDQSNISLLICKNQTDLDRQKFFEWIQDIGFSSMDIADMFGIKVYEPSATASKSESKDNQEPKNNREHPVKENAQEQSNREERTSVSDKELVQTMLNLMNREKLLSGTDFENLQNMYFCLNHFDITNPIVLHFYPSMSPADYVDYNLWFSTKDGIRYLILKKYYNLNRQKLLQWATNRKLNPDDLQAELHCTREALGMKLQPDVPPIQKPPLDYNTAIIDFIRKQPGCNEDTIVNSLVSKGYEREKILCVLDKVPGIISRVGRFYLNRPGMAEPSLLPGNSIDNSIRDFVKSNHAVTDKEVIDTVAKHDFDPDTVAQHLRKHKDVLTIVGHCYVKDSIEGLEEAADILLKTLNELFNRNSGYTSAHELYQSVRAQLDDFFYDNDAFESELEVYQLATYLFEQTGYKDAHFLFKNNIHIWHHEPDYPMGDHGLLILWARENQGMITVEDAYENYRRRGVNEVSLSSNFSANMDKVFDKFWMIQDGIYLLKEKISITPSFLQELRKQIKVLMAEFEFGFIPMWDIGPDWYAGLPSLEIGRHWTSSLLQSIIRDYSDKLGVRTIPRQGTRQLHAAIVVNESDFQDYTDLIYCAVKSHNQAKSVTIDRNELFEMLIADGLWPRESTPPYGSAFQNFFKDNIHFHVIDKNKVMVM